jgi:hypothetical protein
MGNLWKEVQNFSRKHATVFQAEVYAILDCVYEIQMNVRPEKYVSICSESHSDTMSQLVRQCQKVLNGISTQHTVALHWVTGHAGV